MKFLLNNEGDVIAIVQSATSGPCRYGWSAVPEGVNANYEHHLINGRSGTISGAAKYARVAARLELPLARKLNTMKSDDQYIIED